MLASSKHKYSKILSFPDTYYGLIINLLQSVELFCAYVENAKETLDAWFKWARHCRIPAFVELQKKINRHKQSILNTIEYGLSNARIEAINNKIKLSIRMAYGF